MLQRIAHFFGWNTGHVVTFWINRRLYVGFKCDHCGEINHASECHLKDWK